jgi:hypothetical protein
MVGTSLVINDNLDREIKTEAAVEGFTVSAVRFR